MNTYSSPFAPIDRDRSRVADELRAAAQDDTRRRPPAAAAPQRTRPLAARLLHLRPRSPRAH